MNDTMHPISIARLLKQILFEFDRRSTIFGIDPTICTTQRKLMEKIKLTRYGQSLENPIGVAAGPHTQLAQNIISAWVSGARYIELKTVQTLDELEVSKPCIDVMDQGHNCEWSQELKLHESYSEYLKAWIIIHILNDIFSGGNDIQTIFNMSVGYNYDGIQNKNLQDFLSKMKDSSKDRDELIQSLKAIYPGVTKLEIPSMISDNITLSTMHGCPPAEIEKIGMYLIDDLKVHTTIKLNPTLNGPSELREILSNKLGFKDVEVPDIAFDHDLKYEDGIKIIKNLKAKAEKIGVDFSVKLTNTLECINNKNVFDKKNEMMYLSGRPLHALAINLAKKLFDEFEGELDITFCAGVDAFNIADILSCGIMPVTVCTDLLKPGGYGRLNQYVKEINKRMDSICAGNLRELLQKSSNLKDVREAKIKNTNDYLKRVLGNFKYKKSEYPWKGIKVDRLLTKFDCIHAPCSSTCPTNQLVPNYMYHVSLGEFDKGIEVIRKDNPFPYSTGMACDHICEDKCTRINYDSPVLIREIKRFLAHKNMDYKVVQKDNSFGRKISVGIIGAGPSGLSAAYYLLLSGIQVEIYEKRDMVGGMITNILPDFRAENDKVENDIDVIKSLGVKINTNFNIDSKSKFEEIQNSHDYTYIATGAVNSKKLGIDGENSKGVIDFLSFLELAKKKKIKKLPNKVAVIGGGNSAIDAVRTAKRLMDSDSDLFLIYRRTIEQMPASREEIGELLEEKINVLELVSPVQIISHDDKITALKCVKMELVKSISSKRLVPKKIEGTEFEIELDYLISAIGQDVDLGFLPDEIMDASLEQVIYDDKTNSTMLDNIYIGGDLTRGASSIIKCISDGKNVAKDILKREGMFSEDNPFPKKNLSVKKLRTKKIEREYGVKLPKIEVENRNGFEAIVKTLGEVEAQKEAARCLQCDEICDVCVTVCPNRANYSYKVEKFKGNLNDFKVHFGEFNEGEEFHFEINQENQVFNIGDYCNECGNCETFCPSSGAPYRDKPKVYLTRETFKKASQNAFYAENDNDYFCVYAKDEGVRLKIVFGQDDNIFCESAGVKFTVSSSNLKIQKVIKIKKDCRVNYRHIAELIIVAKGLRESYHLFL